MELNKWNKKINKKNKYILNKNKNLIRFIKKKVKKKRLLILTKTIYQNNLMNIDKVFMKKNKKMKIN